MLWLIRSRAHTSRQLGRKFLFAGFCLATVLPSAAGAQTPIADETIAKNTLDGQLILALPASSTFTGMSAGVGAGYSRLATAGGLLAWGARASWSTTTEYAVDKAIRNDDIRLRLCGQIQHHAGRGSFGIRLGAGATAVYEGQTLVQGNRAALPANEVATSSWHLWPAADLEAVVVLRIWKSWGMSLNGGPSLHLIGGGVHAGWTSGLGVAWQP